MPNSFVELDDTWYSSAKAKWREPFVYQERVRGKLVRTELARALSTLFGLHASQTRILCDAVEKMNVSSLIQDDQLDRDELRRGVRSVWTKFGEGPALLSGMCGHVEGLQRLAELNNLDVVCAGIRSIERLHVGQFLDLEASDSKTLLTLEEYGCIAKANTGCFFIFLLEACQCLKPLNEEVYKWLDSMLWGLGIYYRYINDLRDIIDMTHFGVKGFAMDLEGGPKSFLMILAADPLIKGARSSDQKKQIIQAYGDAGVFKEAMDLMEQAYSGLLQCLHAIRQLDASVNIRRLDAFLQSVHFQLRPEDDYYKRLLAKDD
ncbi:MULTISPECIES: polyprenyl synthetase family protein [Pseudomonas]|uniref:Polyprenyl synthetase family protein n=1 Tax=Pseudomonas azadiae TaxID=2843612 RepID=A0ABS6P5N9_9PSED|nr:MULTISPECIES: polyprenyl synthetase family protein [Pseudomonas]MBV4455803.1 polyprenyl synthetase family protein [Pseudomonas azadiae]NMF41705.1 polyprenyl synthetase family protein [Pseudomonas sp. SWRI 103]